MKKWLVITLLALSVFMIILLGLGYLLAENEKASTILKDQLAQEAQLLKEKTRQGLNLSGYPRPLNAADGAAVPKQSDANVMNEFEKALINNLTCVTLAQCQVVTIKFKNIDCKLASNVIGVSQLKKIATHTITMATCPKVNPQSQLACQQNICTLISATQ